MPSDIVFYNSDGICTSNEDFKKFLKYVRDLEYCAGNN